VTLFNFFENDRKSFDLPGSDLKEVQMQEVVKAMRPEFNSEAQHLIIHRILVIINNNERNRS